jgi:AcrR family transcriptional regulator
VGDQTKVRILDAARVCFGDRGYDGTTTRHIAVTAELTTAAIYHYYPSKSELYRAAHEQVHHVVYGRYDDAIARLQDASLTFGPHPDILTYLGFANRKLGRFGIAESYYRQALASAPRHVGATEYFGELMVERGDLAGARRMLAKLEDYCDFGCAEVDELRRWIMLAQARS